MSQPNYSFIPDPEDRILPDIWYEQLMDPPEPPPRPYTNPIFIETVDYTPKSQPVQTPSPSGEGWGEAFSI